MVVMALSNVAGFGVSSAGATTATVTTWTDLANAFSSSGTITLGADITAPNGSNVVMTAGTSVVLDLHGHTLEVTSPPPRAAAILDTGATLTIEDTLGGGLLDATGDSSSGLGGGAGIGGGVQGAGGTVIISGGTVNASGGIEAAGIGGGFLGDGGTVTINGGTVNASGSAAGGGSGIGGGFGGACGTVIINGGSVNATGTYGAAGIGDGDSFIAVMSEGTVTISGGTVDASGGQNAAEIGGGVDGPGATVTIDQSATVSASGGTSAIGPGYSGSFGSLTNGGSLTLETSETMAAGTTATNTSTGIITLDNSLGGSGTMINDGTILLASGGSVTTGTIVTEHDYAVTYNLNGTAGTPPPPQTIYAATFSDDQLSLPAAPGGTNWSSKTTGGVPVTNTTDLSTTFGESSTGATDITLYLHRSATTLTATPALLGLSPLHLYLFTLSATLSGPSGPIAGQPIVFSAGSTQLCTAITQSNGTASCGGLSAALSVLFALGYTATYAGDSAYLPSAAKAGLIG